MRGEDVVPAVCIALSQRREHEEEKDMKTKIGWWLLAAVAAAPALAGWFITIGALACALTGRQHDGSAMGGIALLVVGLAGVGFAILKLEPPLPNTPTARVMLLLMSVLTGGFSFLAAALGATTRTNTAETRMLCGITATVAIITGLLWLVTRHKPR